MKNVPTQCTLSGNQEDLTQHHGGPGKYDIKIFGLNPKQVIQILEGNVAGLSEQQLTESQLTFSEKHGAGQTSPDRQ